MRSYYLRKNQNLKELKKEEYKINNQVDSTINSLNSIHANKYSYNYYKNSENSNSSNSNYFKDKNKNRKDATKFQSNEISSILGKINQELYRNKKNYNPNNIYKYLQKDYLNLKSNNNSYKSNINASNLTRNYSPRSKQISLLNNGKRKTNSLTYEIIFNNSNNYTNKRHERPKKPIQQNNIIPVYGVNQPYNHYYLKNNLSSFILKNQQPQIEYINIDLENDYEDDKNNKIIQVRKKHNSIKREISNSQKKIKRRISPFYNDLQIAKKVKDKTAVSNPKNVNNMGNFYNFWSYNDRHMGGKINLGLNNRYRNTLDFYSSLYYIIKIQSTWKGYSLRKALLKKGLKNAKINIFHKQKLLIKTIFFILTFNFKKKYFRFFKKQIDGLEQINRKKGYEIHSPLLNNISRYYQNSKSGKNIFSNRRRLKDGNKNLELYNINNGPVINSPKVKRSNTKVTDYINNNENNKKINTEYKILKTHAISFKSYGKNRKKDKKEDNVREKEKEQKEKEKEKEKEKIALLNKNQSYRRFLYVLPDDKSTSHFTIKNQMKGLNARNNYGIINSNRNNRKLLNNPINRENNNKVNKYKDYIYFLFLLFARIQKASHRTIFKELIEKLKKKKNNKIIEIRKNKLLKIIKNNKKKAIKHYFKIFKEKILTERIKHIILLKDNKNNFFSIKNRSYYAKNINNKDKINNNNNTNNNNNSANICNINTNNNANKIANNRYIPISEKNIIINIDDKLENKNRQHSKKHIRIKKINRSTSLSQSVRQSNYYNKNSNNLKNSFLALSKSTSKKMIIKQRSNNLQTNNRNAFYEFTPEYRLKKKIADIFMKLDKKEKKFYFIRWKLKKDAKKKKKFLIYFIMLMKEYFCKDKSIKSNKDYAIGKCMFFWYRKTFS